MNSLSGLAVALLAITGGAVIAATAPTSPDVEAIAPIHAPFPMPPLARPTFPSRSVSIVEHGAVAGGEVKNTEAFARAVAACASAGGGRVVVPAGRWLTGPIHLRSHIDLHLEAGAEIVFSDRFADYLPNVLVRVGGIDLYNYSPLIYARDCVDVAITGPGKLNGNAKAWWAWKTRETKEFFQQAAKGVPVEQRVFGTEAAAIRPNFVVFLNCRNVLMEGFTVGGGPNWTLHPVYSENVIIRRVHVLTDGPNNDGIDPDSCRNVLIEHCVFDTGDDCVVLKSGYNEDGWRVARPTENVVMRWCSSQHGHGGLVIGSEMSGDVRNVYLHDCEFEHTDHALRIKSRSDRGGIVENVWAENLTVRDMKYDVAIITMGYGADRNAVTNPKLPVIRNIRVRNVTADGAPAAFRFEGLPGSPLRGLEFENITIASTEGVIAQDIAGMSFNQVKISPRKGPVFALTRSADVQIRHATAPQGSDPFLSLSGKGSGPVRIEASDLSGAKTPYVLGPDVAADAVTLVPDHP